MAEPYADADTSGHLYLDRDQVRDHVVACTRAGKQAGFHVIGDRAMSEVIAGFRAAREIVGPAIAGARHRLEHVEMPSADHVAAMTQCQVVASVQPAFDAAWGGPDGMYETRLGAERAAPMNPLAKMRGAGLILAFGSDSPITPIDPWGAVRAAMEHHSPAQRLTAQEAFTAHTRGGHMARRDDASGVLAPGLRASYAVWDVPGGLDDSQPAGLPLPRLHIDVPAPRCTRAVSAGVTIFNHEETP
jgi:predicted amidohydrolase YtcJ